MSIHDLLTKLDITPGFNPTPTEDSREKYDPATGSDYRDRLARQIGSTEQPEPKAVRRPAPSADSDHAKPNSTAAHSANQSGNSPKASPEIESAESSAPEQSSSNANAAAESHTNPAAQASGNSEIADTKPEQKELAPANTEPEELSESEISVTTIALITVTAAAPVLPANKLEIPETPTGVQELFGSVTTESATLPICEVTESDSAPPVPPTGLIEAFNLQTTTSIADAAVSSTSEKGQQKPEQAFVDGFTADIAAEVNLEAAQSIDQNVQTSSNETEPETTASVTKLVMAQSETSEDVETPPVTQIPVNEFLSSIQTSSDVGTNSQHTGNTQQISTEMTAAPVEAKPVVPQHDHAELQTDESERTSQTRHSKGNRNLASVAAIQQATAELIVGEDQPPIAQMDETNGEPDARIFTDPSLLPPSGSQKSHQTVQTNQTVSSAQLSIQQAQQLVDRVSNALHQSAQSGQSLKVRLNPPELGILQIEVSQRDGVLTARLETQTTSAHQVIVNNLSSLREALAHNGTIVERIEVHVVPNREGDSPSDQTDRRQQDPQQQNPERQQRRDSAQQQHQDKQSKPHVRQAKRSMDQLDIQI